MNIDLPDTARAAVVRQFGQPIGVEAVPIVRRLEPRAILVKIEVCSVCGTDVHLWQGNLSLDIELPIIIGHEMVGRIVALGEDAGHDTMGQPLTVGDRIVYTHTACGSCFHCVVDRRPTLCVNRRAYMYESMEPPPHLLGGFAEYGYVLPESGRIRVPETVSDAFASLASCALRSVINAMSQLGEIAPTETAVVQGTGPLGLLATAALRVRGARRIITIGAPADRLALAEQFGADRQVSVQTTSAEERGQIVLEETNGRGADIVLEFTGNPNAFVEGIGLARRGGRYLVVGQLGDGTVAFAPSEIVKKNLRVIGSFSGDARSYWQAIDFLDAHQRTFPFGEMITGRYGLDQVTEALENMAAMGEIKPLILPHISQADPL